MTDLGNIALWIALLIGIWGSAVAFTAGRTGRAELAASAERSVFVMWGLLAIASAALMRALLAHDFTVEYVAAYTSRNLPRLLHLVGVLRGAEGVAAVLGDRAGDASRWRRCWSTAASTAR